MSCMAWCIRCNIFQIFLVLHYLNRLRTLKKIFFGVIDYNGPYTDVYMSFIAIIYLETHSFS